jgi:hypothetical protein
VPPAGAFAKAVPPNAAARYRQAWAATDRSHNLEGMIRAAPLAHCMVIAVVSPKGGPGKTTITALLGTLLAELRRDPVLALDANPDLGDLGDKLADESAPAAAVDDLAGWLDGHPGATPAELSARLGVGPHGWSQLTSLASSYGWKFTTAGEVYRPRAGLSLTDPITDEAVVQNPAIANASNMQSETCGAKNYMDNKGFPEANGMFDYPNDSVTLDDSDTLQTNYVLGCYYWGRRYSADPQTYGVQVPSGPNGMPVNDNGSGTTPLWYSRVVSVSGGACYSLGTDLPGFPNGTGLTCPGSPPPGNPMPNVTTETQECEACSAAILNEPDSGNGLPLYPNVDGLVTLAQTLTAGHWLDFQFYRLVTGSNLTGSGPTWDCTSSNWRQHWTSDGELFCYTDFTRIMKALPSSATITDPQTVGVAWCSSPPAADTTPAP